MSNKRKPKTKQQRPTAPEPIDFDAVRSKKRRVVKDLPPVKIGGREYALTPSLPLAITDYFAEHAKRTDEGNVVVLLADMQHLLSLLFGDDQWAEIVKVIDISDVPDLFRSVFDAYGESVGESSNSGQS